MNTGNAPTCHLPRYNQHFPTRTPTSQPLFKVLGPNPVELPLLLNSSQHPSLCRCEAWSKLCSFLCTSGAQHETILSSPTTTSYWYYHLFQSYTYSVVPFLAAFTARSSLVLWISILWCLPSLVSRTWPSSQAPPVHTRDLHTIETPQLALPSSLITLSPIEYHSWQPRVRLLMAAITTSVGLPVHYLAWWHHHSHVPSNSYSWHHLHYVFWMCCNQVKFQAPSWMEIMSLQGTTLALNNITWQQF